MLRVLGSLVVVAIVFPLGGCNRASVAEAPAAGSLEYSGWPLLTAKPIPVARALWGYCRMPDKNDPAVREAEQLGPHAVPAIRVYANPIAHAHLREGRPGALPAGSVIVKEKLTDLGDKEAFAFAAMIKKEAGYDPDNGDWEYLYDPLREGEKVERGKLTLCIDCHRQAAAKDYLFRKYNK